MLTLLVEGILVLMLLTLGAPVQKVKEVALSVFNLSADAEDADDTQSPERPDDASPAETAPAEPEPAEDLPQPAEPPSTLPPPVINLTPKQMANADLRSVPTLAPPPAPAKKKVYGPPAPPASSSGDTPRVEGSGPNGEPLYAASWYREPYDDELRGYLSTASGPGWGLIMCRTVANYRVEDCVSLGEYPQGSNIARAVLAAAWQFRVRPPQIGGRPQVGEWVRIRIDYTRRP